MARRIVPFLIFALCFSIGYAGYSDGLISAGEYEWGVEWFSGSLVVNGGGAQEIMVRNSARLEVRSTSTPLGLGVGGIMDVIMTNYSRLDYYGGLTQELSLFKSATANLYGGRIDYINSHQYAATQHVNLYCQSGWSWISNDPLLGITGLWKDGSAFNIRFLNDADYDPVWENINVIPEPATVLLLGVGLLLLKQRRSKINY